jgi:integrase
MPKTPGRPPFSIVSLETTGGSPPRDLGQHGRELWDAVQREYGIADRGGIELLAQACAALDRAEAMAAAIATDGPLAQLGWTEARNVRLEYRCSGSDAASIRRLARELVELQPDVILTESTPATAAALHETRTIPIVFVQVGDPVGSGHLTFLVTKTGKSYGANDFSEQFRKWCDDAGLPKRCTFHGLRKAGCRRLAEAGCSANEIAAWSGQSLREVERYTRAADQARLARNALARTSNNVTDAVTKSSAR